MVVPTPGWEDFSSTPFGEKSKLPRTSITVGKNDACGGSNKRATAGVKSTARRQSSTSSTTTTPSPSKLTLCFSSSAKEVRDDTNAGEKTMCTAPSGVEPLRSKQGSSANEPGQNTFSAPDLSDVFWCDVTPSHIEMQVVAPAALPAKNNKGSREVDIPALSSTSAWIQRATSFGSFLPETTSWMSFGSGMGGTRQQQVTNARTNYRVIESRGKKAKKGRKDSKRLPTSSERMPKADIPTLISLSPHEAKGQRHPADDQATLCNRPTTANASVSNGNVWCFTNRQTKKQKNCSYDDSELLDPMEGVVAVVDVLIDWTLEALAEDEESEAESESTMEIMRRRGKRKRRSRKTSLVRDPALSQQSETRPQRVHASNDAVGPKKPISSTPKAKATAPTLDPSPTSIMNRASEDENSGFLLGNESKPVAGVQSHHSTIEIAHASKEIETSEENVFESDPEKYAIHRIASALSETSLSMGGVIVQGENN